MNDDEMKPEDVFLESINMYNKIKRQQVLMWAFIIFQSFTIMGCYYLMLWVPNV